MSSNKNGARIEDDLNQFFGSRKVKVIEFAPFEFPFEPSNAFIDGIRKLDDNVMTTQAPIARLQYAASGLWHFVTMMNRGYSLDDLKARHPTFLPGLEEFLGEWDRVMNKIMDDKYTPDHEE